LWFVLDCYCIFLPISGLCDLREDNMLIIWNWVPIAIRSIFLFCPPTQPIPSVGSKVNKHCTIFNCGGSVRLHIGLNCISILSAFLFTSEFFFSDLILPWQSCIKWLILHQGHWWWRSSQPELKCFNSMRIFPMTSIFEMKFYEFLCICDFKFILQHL